MSIRKYSIRENSVQPYSFLHYLRKFVPFDELFAHEMNFFPPSQTFTAALKHAVPKKHTLLSTFPNCRTKSSRIHLPSSSKCHSSWPFYNYFDTQPKAVKRIDHNRYRKHLIYPLYKKNINTTQVGMVTNRANARHGAEVSDYTQYHFHSSFLWLLANQTVHKLGLYEPLKGEWPIWEAQKKVTVRSTRGKHWK